MVFNSLTFILFFAIILSINSLPFPWSAKKINLILGSYLFYATWNPTFLLLLLFSTIFNWYLGRSIWQAEQQVKRRKWLLLALFVNLGLLGFFKYSDFFLENAAALFGMIGIKLEPMHGGILLPVGISFYTFQNLSYVLDIYYKRMAPAESFIDFSLWVSFFPKLIAGPITRASEFLPQCRTLRRVSSQQLSWGLALIIIGLFEKMIIADQIFAPVATRVFSEKGTIDVIGSWMGTLAVAGNIFYDFAGYSTCARGIALCLGFELPINFSYPYAAIGFADFWRRWHISLSRWLRDYLFFSLGGIRANRWRIYLNTIITMVLAGLWHGAAWGFIVWGALHGFYLVGERLLEKHTPLNKARRKLTGRILSVVVTFLFVCLGWVFFNAVTLQHGLKIFTSLFNFHTLTGTHLVNRYEVGIILLATSLMLILQWRMRNSSLEELVEKIPWWATSTALAVMTILLIMVHGEERVFIYVQF